MTEPKAEKTKVLGDNIALSLTLVIAIVGGVAANMKMISDIDNQYARVDVKMSNITENLGDLKLSIKEIDSKMDALTSTTTKDLRDLRRENSMFRERLSRLEAEMKKR